MSDVFFHFLSIANQIDIRTTKFMANKNAFFQMFIEKLS